MGLKFSSNFISHNFLRYVWLIEYDALKYVYFKIIKPYPIGYIYIVRYHIPVKIICEGIINNDLCDVYIWFAKKIKKK